MTKNSKKVDYIFANILLNPLKSMAKTITSKVKRKGQIFLSGILIDQVETLLSSYEEHAEKKLIKIVELHMKQWACVQPCVSFQGAKYLSAAVALSEK